MTWDWIADTLYMIESDLRERSKLCPGVARRDTESAHSHVLSACHAITEAVGKMERERARHEAMAKESPAAPDGDIAF